MRQLKIGTASVRGVVGEALTPELVASFACAFGTWCEGRAVAVGRDTRGSSAMMRAATISGLLATGCEVIDLGVCSTPLLSFAVRELGADGGVAITGSHNDADWNALKFIGPDGALLNAVKSEELMDIYRAVVIGFLRSARNVTARELELMVEGVEIIALELGMRFLTDHLRGDSYFRLGPADPPDLNKIRGLSQLTLYQRLRARADEARQCMRGLREEFGVKGDA